MRPLSAAWIAQAVGGELRADAALEVTSVARDSRECLPGSLYVAFPGERADGHQFVGDAARAGAVLHLTTREVGEPHVVVDDTVAAIGRLASAYLALLREQSGPRVIGVTGSVGKTTTKDLLASILPNAVAPRGSFNNQIGLPLTVLSAGDDTRFLVLEMGANGAGHIRYLTEIAPLDVACVLVVGTAHVGEFGSIDDVARAKAEILAGLSDGGVAILNADDDRVAAMAPLAARVVTFGLGSADVRATGVRTAAGRASFAIEAAGSAAQVDLRLVGEHHVVNALAAAAIALECGQDLADIASRLSAATPASPHRMAVVERRDGVTVIDDSYNASPESMRAALRALREVAGDGRTFAVVGEMREMGEHSLAAHDAVGALAVRLGIDRLVVVGEGARPTYDAAVREGSFGGEAAYVATIEEAAQYLAPRVAEGDTVLVKASHGSGLWRLADHLTGAAPLAGLRNAVSPSGGDE